MPLESILPATVVWFRRDLRLSDNPALEAAVARGGAVVAVWVHAPGEEGDSAPGAAARVFLHDALQSLAESLEARGSRLVLRRGPAIKALIDLARETGADAVYANKAWEPPLLARDAKAVAALRANGLDARLFDDGVLFPPDAMKTTAGGPFRVFTPFWRRCRSSPGPGEPLPRAVADPFPGDASSFPAVGGPPPPPLRPLGCRDPRRLAGGREGGGGSPFRIPGRRDGRLPRRPRPPGPGRDVPALPVPSLRLRRRAPGVARGPVARGGGQRAGVRARRGGVPSPAGVA